MNGRWDSAHGKRLAECKAARLLEELQQADFELELRREAERAKIIANARSGAEGQRSCARRMACSMLLSGVTPREAKEVILNFGCEIPPKKVVDQEMKILSKTVVDFALTVCREAKEELQGGDGKFMISFDGSWSQRRAAERCFVSVICQETGKVLAYQCLQSLDTSAANYCDIPQNMEVKGLRMILESFWPDEESRASIAGYVHDNDSKDDAVFRDSGWSDLMTYLDPRHATKSFARRAGSKKAMSGNGVMPQWVQDSLEKFLHILLAEKNLSPDEKASIWRNSLKHFAGDHSGCRGHKEGTRIWAELQNECVARAFDTFLENTEFIVRQVNLNFSTQHNESLNRGKIKYATKDVHWGYTWDARMACAVLDKNRPNWKKELRAQLFPQEWEALPKAVEMQLEEMERGRLTRKEYVMSERGREEKRQCRLKKRQMDRDKREQREQKKKEIKELKKEVKRQQTAAKEPGIKERKAKKAELAENKAKMRKKKATRANLKVAILDEELGVTGEQKELANEKAELANEKAQLASLKAQLATKVSESRVLYRKNPYRAKSPSCQGLVKPTTPGPFFTVVNQSSQPLLVQYKS
jgi:hypothetical protein